jgi:benzylsuccinate CoA-transferase BbsE subunit
MKLGGVPFAFLNVNKKSVTIDAATPPGRAVFCDLVATAQVVVYEPGSGAGIELADILAVPGPRVVTAISHFGLTGPYAHFVGCDLVDQALGGIAWLSGEAGRPPLRLAGDQSIFVASLYAAAATALALWDTEKCGASHMIDVSAQEAIAHSLQNAIQAWDLERHVSVRGGEGIRDATEGGFVCKDGYVFLAAPLSLKVSWTGLLAWMKAEGFDGLDTLLTPAWNDRPTRATATMRDQFRALFERFVADKSKAELTAEALRRKIVLAPVSRIADLPHDPQLLFRQYFHKLAIPGLGREVAMPGAPYRLSEPLWRLDRAAPRLGEDNATVLEAGSADARRAGVQERT